MEPPSSPVGSGPPSDVKPFVTLFKAGVRRTFFFGLVFLINLVSAVWLFDLFDRCGVRATFAVPAVVAEAYPDTVRAVVARGHEVAAHGLRHEDVSGLAAAEEAHRLRSTIDALAA